MFKKIHDKIIINITMEKKQYSYDIVNIIIEKFFLLVLPISSSLIIHYLGVRVQIIFSLFQQIFLTYFFGS